MRRLLPRATAALSSAMLALGILVATAVPAVACSCVESQPMAAYAGDANQVIFTGVVQPPDGRDVPVRVTRWFQGPDRNAFVRLAGRFGEDGASCGTPLPLAGTEWIFVAYRSEEGPELGVNLCTPHASANTAQGRAMFADAVATFGEGPRHGPAAVAADDRGDADGADHAARAGHRARVRGRSCGRGIGHRDRPGSPPPRTDRRRSAVGSPRPSRIDVIASWPA